MFNYRKAKTSNIFLPSFPSMYQVRMPLDCIIFRWLIFFKMLSCWQVALKKENHYMEFWPGRRTGFPTIPEPALIHSSATLLHIYVRLSSQNFRLENQNMHQLWKTLKMLCITEVPNIQPRVNSWHTNKLPHLPHYTRQIYLHLLLMVKF